MATKRVAGTCFVRVDGESVEVGATITVSPLAVMRESVSGLSGPVGYKETPRAPWIEVEVITTAAFDLLAMGDVTDATVQVDMGRGERYVLRNAWLAGEPEESGADGTVTLRFEGLQCVQV